MHFMKSLHEYPPVIARHRVAELTGGAIAPKTLANADSMGCGPRERFKVGRTICYPREALLAWLDERITG